MCNVWIVDCCSPVQHKRGARVSTEDWFHPFSVFAKYLGTKHHNGLYWTVSIKKFIFPLTNCLLFHCKTLTANYFNVFLWLTASLRQKATMLLQWVRATIESEPTMNCTNFDLIFPDLSPFLVWNIVSCSTFVVDSFEWPQMLIGISTWSHKKSLICHVLSKLPSRLMPSTGRWVLFFKT